MLVFDGHGSTHRFPTPHTWSLTEVALLLQSTELGMEMRLRRSWNGKSARSGSGMALSVKVSALTRRVDLRSS